MKPQRTVVVVCFFGVAVVVVWFCPWTRNHPCFGRVCSGRLLGSPFLDNGCRQWGSRQWGTDNRGSKVVVFEGAKTSAAGGQPSAQSKCGPKCCCYLCVRVATQRYLRTFLLGSWFCKRRKCFYQVSFYYIFGYPGCIVSNAADSQWENNLAPSPTAQTAQTCTLAQK